MGCYHQEFLENRYATHNNKSTKERFFLKWCSKETVSCKESSNFALRSASLWISFRMEIVASSLNSSISFYVYLFLKVTKPLIKTLDLGHSLGIDASTNMKRVFNQSFLLTHLVRHKVPLEQNWTQRVTGLAVLFWNKTQLDDRLAQIYAIAPLQNLLQKTFQWQFSSTASVHSGATCLHA